MTKHLMIMAALVAGWATAAAAADVLVLRSAGASAARYKVGTRLGDAMVVTLAAGDRLVLLDDRGVRDLQGPKTVALGDPGGLARPLSLGDFGMHQRPVIGGTRGFVGAFNLVDIGVAEPQCMIEGWPVFASRSDKAEGHAYRLTQPANGQEAVIRFVRGQDRAAWPAALLSPGGQEDRLAVRDEDGGREFMIMLRRLAGRPASNLELASLLLAHGCDRELLRRAQVE